MFHQKLPIIKTQDILLSLEEYFKSENPLESKPKGKIKQGGVGYNFSAENAIVF